MDMRSDARRRWRETWTKLNASWTVRVIEMAEGNDAESRLRAATERLMAIPGEFAGRGVSGSHEKALAINEAELQARSEKVEALREIQAAGLGPNPGVVQDAITREEAEIANNKRNIGRYGSGSS